MKRNITETGIAGSRLSELQDKYREMEPLIHDPHVKRTLSVIYGMLQETWRQINNISSGTGIDKSIEDILNLYRKAPKMDAVALNEPLKEGIQAPDFKLKDAHGNAVRLSDYKGTTVLLVFYPLDWSPGCSQQLDLYQSEIEEFDKRNVQILAISVDSIYSHGAWAAVRDITFPLLSDFNPRGEVADKYNVYRKSDGFSERALYIIDKEGVIRYSYVSPYLHHIPDINDLFKKMDAIGKPAVAV